MSSCGRGLMQILYMRSPLEFLKMKPGEQMLMKGFIIDKIEGA